MWCGRPTTGSSNRTALLSTVDRELESDPTAQLLFVGKRSRRSWQREPSSTVSKFLNITQHADEPHFLENLCAVYHEQGKCTDLPTLRTLKDVYLDRQGNLQSITRRRTPVLRPLVY